MSLLLGIDVGSSSVKTSILNTSTGRSLASAMSPEREMQISAPFPGWAEQHPSLWWDNLKLCINKLKMSFNFDASDIKAIGVTYQMHGLVLVDRKMRVLRPAIIWCDSRAVENGVEVQKALGRSECFKSLLNLPGNFTASKLKWVKDNEPEVFQKAHKFMLPGDYIALKMTGRAATTPPGLSEGIMWDYRKKALSLELLDKLEISPKLAPDIVPVFSVQGELTKEAADELGLGKDTPVSYRAGDQPNNAFSLGVLDPGDIAASAGTSGVLYGVTQKTVCDRKSRVNVFLHVNDSPDKPRQGVLACVNGAGILYSWIRKNIVKGANYNTMNCLAMEVPPGSRGVMCFPFGNGAERTLLNCDPGAFITGLNFNTHDERHIIRASIEGVVFALNYGLEIMREMKMEPLSCRAGKGSMFLSQLFRTVFTNTSGLRLDVYDTDGAEGAARGAGIGASVFKSVEDAFAGLYPEEFQEPDEELSGLYGEAYGRWKSFVESGAFDLPARGAV